MPARRPARCSASWSPPCPAVPGIGDTVERRCGKRVAAEGACRDPVRSSKGRLVKASGLRWLSLTLLVPILWADRVRALPFLTALAPSERYRRARERRHKRLADWARQLVLQARRWLPGRELVPAADSGSAALDLLAAPAHQGPTRATRLWPGAALHEPVPPRRPGTVGRPRTRGARLPNLAAVLVDEATSRARVAVPGWYGEGERVVEPCSCAALWRHAGLPVAATRWVLLRDPQRRFDPRALLCAYLACDPPQVVRWFVRRWQAEVTFREERDHLGAGTQRRWSDRAVARTTPCLLALFSIVTLLAARLDRRARPRVSASAWCHEKRPTFSDTLAAARRQLWREQGLLTSRHSPEPAKLRPALREGVAHALRHAA